MQLGPEGTKGRQCKAGGTGGEEIKTDWSTAAMHTALYKGKSLDEEEISGRVSGKKDEDRLEAGLQ